MPGRGTRQLWLWLPEQRDDEGLPWRRNVRPRQKFQLDARQRRARSATTGMNASELLVPSPVPRSSAGITTLLGNYAENPEAANRERSSLRACLRLCIGRCVDARRCGIAKVQDINAGPIQTAASRGWYCSIRDNRKTIPPCGDLSGLLNADDCHQLRLSHQGRTRSQISLPSLYHRNDPIAEESEIGSFGGLLFWLWLLLLLPQAPSRPGGALAGLAEIDPVPWSAT